MIAKDNHSNPYIVKWPELITGTLEKRYKRFLADVRLENGDLVTAHCSNSGSMKECSEPNSTVFLSRANNPKRKLKFTWELIKMPDSLVGVNTGVPNKFVKNAILEGQIAEITGYDSIKPEVKTSDGSRLDLMLKKNEHETCYIEIKNCSLVKNGLASFPDAVTTRGQKHLGELVRLKKLGHRAINFYLIQRMDADRFSPAASIDPEYAKKLKSAVKNGVEILVYDTIIDLKGIKVGRRLPVEL